MEKLKLSLQILRDSTPWYGFRQTNVKYSNKKNVFIYFGLNILLTDIKLGVNLQII